MDDFHRTDLFLGRYYWVDCYGNWSLDWDCNIEKKGKTYTRNHLERIPIKIGRLVQSDIYSRCQMKNIQTGREGKTSGISVGSCLLLQ